jgi:hypothetical protein
MAPIPPVRSGCGLSTQCRQRHVANSWGTSHADSQGAYITTNQFAIGGASNIQNRGCSQVEGYIGRGDNLVVAHLPEGFWHPLVPTSFGVKLRADPGAIQPDHLAAAACPPMPAHTPLSGTGWPASLNLGLPPGCRVKLLNQRINPIDILVALPTSVPDDAQIPGSAVRLPSLCVGR